MKPEDIEIINENGLLYNSKFMLNFPKIQTLEGMKQLKKEILEALEKAEILDSLYAKYNKPIYDVIFELESKVKELEEQRNFHVNTLIPELEAQYEKNKEIVKDVREWKEKLSEYKDRKSWSWDVTGLLAKLDRILGEES